MAGSAIFGSAIASGAAAVSYASGDLSVVAFVDGIGADTAAAPDSAIVGASATGSAGERDFRGCAALWGFSSALLSMQFQPVSRGRESRWPASQNQFLSATFGGGGALFGAFVLQAEMIANADTASAALAAQLTGRTFAFTIMK